MLSWLRYLTIILILLVPTAAVDDVIGGIESLGWRYTIRILLLIIALTFIRLVQPPVKGP